MDRLERELEGQARVIRLSVLNGPGREMARQYGVMGVPTFLVFDERGELLDRQVGFPDGGKIKTLTGASPDPARS